MKFFLTETERQALEKSEGYHKNTFTFGHRAFQLVTNGAVEY